MTHCYENDKLRSSMLNIHFNNSNIIAHVVVSFVFLAENGSIFETRSKVVL